MRTDVPPAAAALAGLRQTTTVSVTYAGRVLAMGIPVESGRLVVQADQDVPQRVDMILPRWHGRHDLKPSATRYTFGADGHRVTIDTRLSDGHRTGDVPLSTYRVESWEVDGPRIKVGATGLLQKVLDHQAAEEQTLVRRSPIIGELVLLLREDGLDVVIHDDVPLGAGVPSGFVLPTDRGEALAMLASTAPVRMRQGWDGAIHVLPALTDALSPVHEWTEGKNGVRANPPRSGSREGVFNQIHVPWEEPEVEVPEGEEAPEPPSGVYPREITTGRLAVDTYDRVTRRHPTTVESYAQAQAVAMNELAKAGARHWTEDVRRVTDWSIEVDDVAALSTADDGRLVGRVTGVEYPLTPADGEQVVDLGVSA